MLVRQNKITAAAARCVLLVSNRTTTRTPFMCAPPMRYPSVPKRLGLFIFSCVSILGYPTYVMLNLDNVRPFKQTHFNDELKEKLEERRRLRAEGKLNVLQKKL
ncbi:hypothetical protein niasHT_024462 [Heterodera trifolii]|uniref:Uncharacterized protein n=1 Tax=Heterodera trifolii TaxID=157864 RepID=A0ABD2JYE5_9BILA